MSGCAVHKMKVSYGPPVEAVGNAYEFIYGWREKGDIIMLPISTDWPTEEFVEIPMKNLEEIKL